MRYYIHHNYSRPFAVDIEGDTVHVFKLFENGRNNNSIYTDKPILSSYNPERIFIGRSPETRATRFSGGYGERFDGNSILLHIRDNEYIFIGAKIFKFQSNDNDVIVEFISPVGNNDVPYPYAITENGKVYLLIENVVLQNFVITEDYDDPYDYYYDHGLITVDMGRVPQRPPQIHNHLNITEYYLGENQYTMRYNPNPSEEYDRVIPGLGEKMYVVIDEIKREFSKEEYVDLMVIFGVNAGFQDLSIELSIECE